MPLDAVRIVAEICDLEIMGLIGRSIDDYPNIDESQAVYSHQDRWFWGVQAKYNGFRDHSIFAYYLSNYDMTDPKEPDPVSRAVQDYDYTSQYIGVGSVGQLVLPNLRYQLEVVGEMGRTHSYLSGPHEDQDDICAWAMDAQLAYYFTELPMRPKVWAQYLYASGDSDRRTSTTSTIQGNRQGTTDYAFNGFGFRDTGLSYFPDISNLQMWQVGGSFFPLEKFHWAKDMEVGTKVFFYAKADGAGPTDDTTIDNPGSRYLGWEWDAYIDWRITTDVSLTVRYGAFFPGAAYSDNDSCRQFVYAALTYSF
ncbi:MAG: alginate export family protein, partial [Planctomycetota bacterium]